RQPRPIAAHKLKPPHLQRGGVTAQVDHVTRAACLAANGAITKLVGARLQALQAEAHLPTVAGSVESHAREDSSAARSRPASRGSFTASYEPPFGAARKEAPRTPHELRPPAAKP